MKRITFLFLFFIICHSNAQIVASQNYDVSLGWTSTTVLNDANVTISGLSRVTTGTTPTCSPFAGAGMAKFDSYDITAGRNATLTSQAITFSGLEYKIKFKMYRDNGYSTSNDNIAIYINSSSSLTGATLLGTVNRSLALAPIESAEGWYTYSFNLPSATTGSKYIIIKGTSGYGNNIFIDEVSLEKIPDNDPQLKALNVNSFIINGATNISGTIYNLGLNPINSIDINWQIDSGTIHTQTFSGLNIANNQLYNFTHQDQWLAPTGQYTLNVWVSNVNNGATDSDTSNNQIAETVNVVNEIFPKSVLYEEGTGTWCGWCVRGHVGLKDMYHNHSDGSFIGVAVHNGDPMVLSEYDSAMSGLISGYPSGVLNRVASEIDPGINSLEPSFQAELNKTPIAKVAIPNQSWNPSTRSISMDVEAKFALDLASANYNLAAIIVEDGVVGTGTTYDQHNYYSSQGIDIIDWEGINWRNLGSPIPAANMVYNHVGRALLGGYAGVSGSVPNSVTYNTPYTYTFNYTLPTTQFENNIKLIAIVIDNATSQIVNAKEVALNTALSTNNVKETKFNIYPNPSKGLVYINTLEPVSVDVIDVLGKIVFSAKNISNAGNIDISLLQKGVYLVKVSNESGSETKKIILD